jgi:hypothetical protein
MHFSNGFCGVLEVMHSLVESHTIAEIMEKKEKEVLFILSHFFHMSFQTSVLAFLECNLDSRPKLYGPYNENTSLQPTPLA